MQNYYLQIDNVPKCDFVYDGPFIPNLPTCSHSTLEDAEKAQKEFIRLCPGHLVLVVQGVCPSYKSYCEGKE